MNSALIFIIRTEFQQKIRKNYSVNAGSKSDS